MNDQTKESFGKQYAPDNICCSSCHDSAKSVLANTIKQKEKEAKDLQIILNMLPTQLTPTQDEALWYYLISRD